MIEAAVPVGFDLHKTPVNPAKVPGVGGWEPFWARFSELHPSVHKLLDRARRGNRLAVRSRRLDRLLQGLPAAPRQCDAPAVLEEGERSCPADAAAGARYHRYFAVRSHVLRSPD